MFDVMQLTLFGFVVSSLYFALSVLLATLYTKPVWLWAAFVGLHAYSDKNSLLLKIILVLVLVGFLLPFAFIARMSAEYVYLMPVLTYGLCAICSMYQHVNSWPQTD